MRAAILLFCAAATGAAQSFVIVSGNGQVLQEQSPSTQPFVVQALDASGRPVSGLAISWSLTQGTSGGTIVSQTRQTDSEGKAQASFFSSSLQLGVSTYASSVTATSSYGSLNFFITVVPSRVPGGGFAPLPSVQLLEATYERSGPANSTLANAIRVQVVAASGSFSGQGIPNVGLRLEMRSSGGPVASCDAPGGVALTDNRGFADCRIKLGSVTGSAQFIVRVGEFLVFNNFPFNLTVTPGTPCVYTLTPLQQNLAAIGGTGSFQVSTTQACAFTAASNASWLTISSGGSATGTANVTYSAAANTGAQRSGTISVANQSFTVTQLAAGPAGGGSPAFTVAQSLPSATTNVSYSTGLNVAGGTPPYQWSTTGTLPPGLTLNAASGVLSGVPTSQGAYSFVVSARDAANLTVSQTFNLSVLPASAPGSVLITTTSFPNGSVGAVYQQPITYSGGCQNPFSGQPAITLLSGALPTGLTLVSGGLSITGTPAAAGVFSFSLRIADSCGATSTRDFSITIDGAPTPAAITATPAALSFQAQIGSALPPEQTIAIASGSSALAFSAIAQSVNGWLSVRPSNATTPSSIIVTIGTLSNLAPGTTYQGTITISSQASNSPFTIPVTLTLAAAAPAAITASPLLLSFGFTQGTTTIQEQVVTVNSSIATPFTASVNTSNGGNWLAASPTSGSAPSPLRIVVNTVGLNPGEYAGTVTVAPAANPSAAQVIQIRLTVSAAATLTVGQSSLTFAALPGGFAPAPQSIPVGSTGAAIGFTASAVSTGWLTVTPVSGATPSALIANVNPQNLSPGLYQGSISIIPESTRIPTVVAVNLTVSGSSVLLSSVTNAASFAPGAVAPGEFITIFGNNLGSATPAGLSLTAEGTVATTLAGTRVLFDGIVAPLIYVSASQISAIVPYSVSSRSSTRIEVETNGTRSTATEVAVVASSPGIFTAGGTNQAAALNQDGSVNSAVNPADAGSIISLYATGEGQTSPPGQDGLVTGIVAPFARPLLGVAVSIGGQPAEILYAGAAPGLPAGVLQVNARIPAGLRGNAPVILLVGQNTSQSNAVISVR